MKAITEGDLANLAKNQKVPYIIVFDGDTSSGAVIYKFPKYQGELGNGFLIVYAKKRAMVFTKDCDTRIGTFEKRFVYWPEKYPRVMQEPPPANPTDEKAKGFIHGKLLTYVSCSLRIVTPEVCNPKPSFSTDQMEESPKYFKLRINKDFTNCDIELYFEISAALDTHNGNARLAFHKKPPGNPMFCVETKNDEWYSVPQRLHKLTCFDNPFGPYTNFTIQLHSS